jgi:hypothetical protein
MGQDKPLVVQDQTGSPSARLEVREDFSFQVGRTLCEQGIGVIR